MPLPKPRVGESRNDFVNRCMTNKTLLTEYPDQEQRVAVCYSQFAQGPATLSINKKEKILELRHLMSDLIRHETMDDVEYLVCPTVLICVGVHNSIFYPDEELQKFPDSWNGRPVVINHPDVNGKPITANSPNIVEQQTVGQIFNVYYENNKLKGEAWINIEKCRKLSPEILTKLQQNQRIEVSTGLFTENDGQAGEWNDEKFLGTVYNYRPDHLALLPNDVGACSWDDGGGLPRINKQKEGAKDMTTKIKDQLRALGKSLGLVSNELSHDDIETSLRDVTRASLNLGQNEFIYVRDVFDKYFIYVFEKNDSERTIYKQGYAIGADDKITLVGDRVEVKPVMEYVPVTQNRTNKNGGADQSDSTNTGGSEMNRSEEVNALIANSDWGEGDRKMLESMEDDQFMRLKAGVDALKVNANADDDDEGAADDSGTGNGAEGTEGNEGTDGASDADNKDGADKDKPTENSAKTVEEFLANAPEGIRESLQRAVTRDKEIKTNMVKELTANKGCPFSEAELNGKTIDDLEKLLTLSGSAKKAPDFSARVPAEDMNVNSEMTVPSMPQVCAAKKDA